MQPDSSSPAARTPSFTFSEDMVYFQSKVLRPRRLYCVRNATIPLATLSPKLAIIPAVRWLSRVAGCLLCLFCLTSCGFVPFLGKSAGGRPIGATLLPLVCRKFAEPVHVPVTKHLPESS